MKKNKSMIVIIFILLIFLNTIHASEYNDTNINNSNDNQLINQIDNQDDANIFNVKNNNELQKALNNVSRTDKKYNEINIEQQNYSFRTPLNTNKNEKTIVINGNNSTIDGLNNNRFALISQKVTLILNNLTIKNMQFEIGGAITNSGTLIANNCIFENNMANGNSEFGGGAIYNEGSMTLNNCIFRNNTAYTSGSSIFNNINLQNDTNVLINNSYFEKNYSKKGSTLDILGCSSIKIVNTTFFNNTSNGSTIFNGYSNMTILDSMIINENAKGILSNNVTCNIINTTIKNNYNTEIIIENDNLLNIINSSISNNSANILINNKENLLIKNTLINNNFVNQSLIKNVLEKETSTTNISDSILSNNIANLTCGALNCLNSRLFINNSLIQNNTSLKNEGIIQDYNGQTYIRNSKFYNNTSEDLFKGYVDKFVEVQENEYLGNNLKIQMNIDFTDNNGNISINLNLKAEEIYNTTVNNGIIVIYQNEVELSNTQVTNNNPTINTSYNPAPYTTLTVSYNGNTHFTNKSEEIIVSTDNDEYTLTVTNITEEFEYGEYIHYTLTIMNTGNTTIKNVELTNLLPEGLTLIDSSIEFNPDNSYKIDNLNVNESLNIYINASANYEDLDLLFNIYDEKNDKNFFIEKNIKFLSPSISLSKINAHIGEYINITCNLNNFQKQTIDKITFIFKNTNVSFNDLKVENNQVKIFNYKISDKYSVGEYNYELICKVNELENSFSSKSKIVLSKRNTFSVISTSISKNLLNVSAHFYDENRNTVLTGSVLLKINGKSVKTLKINNSGILLENYVIDKKYQQDQYEILLIFTGNNMYNTSRNSSTVSINKEDINIYISYEIKENTITFIYSIKDSEKTGVSEGYIALKINGKSISPKIPVPDNECIFSYDLNGICNLKNVTLSYYGCSMYNEKMVTVPIENY